MSPYERLEIEPLDQIVVARFVDEQLYEHMILSEVQDELLSLLDSGEPLLLLVDFCRVQFCSTSLINCLLRLQRDLTGLGGKLAFCGMRENVREAFVMLNLAGNVFEIFDTLADASHHLRPEAQGPTTVDGG